MKTKAFSLLEVLAAIAVLAVLGALLVSATGSFQKRKYVAGTQSNMRQIYLAMTLFAADHGGKLPKVSVLGSEGAAADYVFTLSGDGVADFAAGGLVDYLDGNEKVFLAPGDRGLRSDGTAGRNFSFGFNFLINKGELLPGDSGPTGFHKALDTVKLLNILQPSRKILLFEEDRPNDPFCVWFIDRPTARHGGRAAFVFADGHAELLRPDDVFGNAELCELVSPDSQY